MAERLGHLEADVAATDDHGSPVLGDREPIREHERIVDGVQQVHAVEAEPVDRRSLRLRARAR